MGVITSRTSPPRDTERAMSQVPPDIEVLVHPGYSCWNRSEIDLMTEDYADDTEVDTTSALPDGRCYKGREEFVSRQRQSVPSYSGSNQTRFRHGGVIANRRRSPAATGSSAIRRSCEAGVMRSDSRGASTLPAWLPPET